MRRGSERLGEASRGDSRTITKGPEARDMLGLFEEQNTPCQGW